MIAEHKRRRALALDRALDDGLAAAAQHHKCRPSTIVQAAVNRLLEDRQFWSWTRAQLRDAAAVQHTLPLDRLDQGGL